MTLGPVQIDDDNSPDTSAASPSPSPQPATQSGGGGGFGGLLRAALPKIMQAVQAVGGGYAAASGNPLPAEMVLNQQKFNRQMREKQQMDAEVENERQMRITDLGLDIQRKKDELRLNPPQSPQDLMKNQLEFFQKKADIVRASQEPQTFQTADGKIWYKGDPGQPSAPVLIPNAAPTNFGQMEPGAQGPVSPTEAADFLKQNPTKQAIGKVPTAPGGAEDEYRDFASDPQFAGDPAAAARAYEAMKLKGQQQIKDPVEEATHARVQLEGLQNEDKRINERLKVLAEDSQTLPKDQREAATTEMQQLRARQDIVRSRIDQSLGLNKESPAPSSSTIKTLDNQDPSNIKVGQVVYDKTGKPRKVKAFDAKTATVTLEK